MGTLVEQFGTEDMNIMLFKKYILTTLRLMLSKWWVSLIKVFSLTSGILSFLLVWLFYIDHHLFLGGYNDFWRACSIETAVILSIILIVTSVIYFLVMKSQMQLRHKELFFRKFYGEAKKGVIGILLIETSIFILISFLLSLVLIDQVAPVFNLITEKNVDLRQQIDFANFVSIFIFLSLLGFVIGILPSIWYARKRAVDILKKLRT